MKFAWQMKITDVVAWNSRQIDEVDLDEYQELLDAKVVAEQFDMDADEFVLEDLRENLQNWHARPCLVTCYMILG